MLGRGPRPRDPFRRARSGLDSACRRADPVARAHAHHGLANAYTGLARYDEARTHYRHAIAAFRKLGEADRRGADPPRRQRRIRTAGPPPARATPHRTVASAVPGGPGPCRASV